MNRKTGRQEEKINDLLAFPSSCEFSEQICCFPWAALDVSDVSLQRLDATRVMGTMPSKNGRMAVRMVQPVDAQPVRILHLDRVTFFTLSVACTMQRSRGREGKYMPLDRMSLLLAITSAAILSGCAALGEAEPVGGAAQAYAGNPRILPPNSSPSGHTYAEWAAKWWQWSLSFPPESNPMLDTTGQFCDLGQEGSVWFLAGVLNGDGTKVVRNCTIPAGEKLFFPLVNAVWVTTCVGEPRTIEGIHALNALGPAVDAVSGLLSAEIDGVPVEQLNRYRVESPLFCTPLDAFGVAPGDVAASCPPPGVAPSEPLCHDLPNPEELFGPEGGFGPAMTDGYWLMLAPLAAGEHTIRFIADDSQNVTYHITVVPGH